MPETFDFGPHNPGQPGAGWNSSYKEPTNWRGLAYAPWPLRAISGFVDYIAPWLLVNWLASHIGGDGIGEIGLFAFLAFIVANSVIAQGRSGRSLGKALTRTRLCSLITTAHGDEYCQIPGMGVAMVKAFAHVIDLILLWGWLRPLWQQDRRTFADSAAGTVVVMASETRVWTSLELSKQKHIGGRYGW